MSLVRVQRYNNNSDRSCNLNNNYDILCIRLWSAGKNNSLFAEIV